MLHLTISLLISVNPPAWEAPVELDWFIGDCNPVSMAIGFGDWATNTEGPHPGLDFTVDNEYLHSPLTSDGYIIGQWPPVSAFHISPQGSLVFGPDNPEYTNWGWQIDHIEKPLTAERWADYSPGTYVGSGTNLDLQASPDNIFRHFHLYWMWVWYSSSYGDWVPGAIYNGEEAPAMKGYVNPVQYLPQEDLIGYDTVGFRRVLEESENCNRGIWFSPDGKEIAEEFGLSITSEEFQEAVFGVVDFAVAPCSEFIQGGGNRDSCGVYSIGHRLAWVNPYFTNTYDPVLYENVFDDTDTRSAREYDYNYRTLFEMKGQLPYDTNLSVPAYTDEYRAVFLDGYCIGESEAITELSQWWFNSAYILSNSGNLTTGSTGWDNVWKFDNPSYKHYWDTNVMCIGGWDTRLRRGDRDGGPLNPLSPISQFSLYPDGEYLVDVAATSHGSAFLTTQVSEQIYLPRDDLEDPFHTESPIVVDNHMPYVDSVIVYSKPPSPYALPIVYFSSGWVEDTENMCSQPINHTNRYPTESGNELWIAVRYSEPVNVSPYDVSMHAFLQGSETWNAGYCRPMPTGACWPDRFGELDHDRLSGGFWQLYRCSSAPPSTFQGPISIVFPHSSLLTDFAGNMIDGDPSTITSPRSSDGSWDLASYDQHDNVYTWGYPTWYVEYVGDHFECFAQVNETEVARHDIPYIYNPESSMSFDGYIYYSCGTYLRCIQNPLEKYIFVIDLDGIVSEVDIYSRGAAEIMPDDTRTWVNYNPYSSSSYPGNYLWIRYRQVMHIGYLYVIDSNECWNFINGQTGESYWAEMCHLVAQDYREEWEYCDAWAHRPTGTFYYINSNDPEPTFNGSSWTVPVYFIDDYEYDHYFMGNVVLSATSNSLCSSPEIEEVSYQQVDAQIEDNRTLEVLSVSSNPVAEMLSIKVNLPDQGQYSILVYDVCGRVIADLSRSFQSSGSNTIEWDVKGQNGTRIPSGCYFLTVSSGEKTIHQRFLVY
ncbi:MAG TPA: T9SS type A sorting domain-containing protein [Candidatus Sabulitectum sp.]|nr:T9SS type A sorting domain-containing protein [Candidatus Sabulitectum sp.]HPJ29193.1 T9SS type A sorting domain-containing protein [Candidatus Sabulitectum sp.]HPR21632.1 T9SS type A sorting domain-containing protein [Candidatus Sabulitectum sp.]